MTNNQLTKAQLAVLRHLVDGDHVFRSQWKYTSSWVIQGDWGTVTASAKTIDVLFNRALVDQQRNGDKSVIVLTDAGRNALAPATAATPELPKCALCGEPMMQSFTVDQYEGPREVDPVEVCAKCFDDGDDFPPATTTPEPSAPAGDVATGTLSDMAAERKPMLAMLPQRGILNLNLGDLREARLELPACEREGLITHDAAFARNTLLQALIENRKATDKRCEAQQDEERAYGLVIEALIADQDATRPAEVQS